MMVARNERVIDLNELPAACCDATAIFIDERGQEVCKHCGMVHGHEYVGQDRRAYSKEERDARCHSAPMVRFPCTAITLHDINVFMETAVQRARMAYLRKIHYQTVKRGDFQNRAEIARVCMELGLSDVMKADVERIYTRARGMKLAHYGMASMIAASAMAAARLHGVPVMLADLAPVLPRGKDGKHFLDQTYHKIVRIALPAMRLKLPPVNIRLLLHYRAARLRVGPAIEYEAVELARSLDKGSKLVLQGKSPDAIVAGLLYYTMINDGSNVTQEKIARACNVTEVTLRHVVQVLDPPAKQGQGKERGK